MLHILTLTYLHGPDAVASSRPAHVAWLRGQLEAGRIVVAGPQTSGGGAVIITAELSELEVADLISSDPWVEAELVSYDRVSLNPKYLAPGVFLSAQPDESVTLINVALTNDSGASINALSEAVNYVAGTAAGFRGARLLTSVEKDSIINLAQWDSETQFRAIFDDPDFTSRYEAFAETIESSRFRLYRTDRVISPTV